MSIWNTLPDYRWHVASTHGLVGQGINQTTNKLIGVLTSAARAENSEVNVGIFNDNKTNLSVSVGGQRHKLFTNVFEGTPAIKASHGGHTINPDFFSGLTQQGGNLFIGPGFKLDAYGKRTPLMESFTSRIESGIKSNSLSSLRKTMKELSNVFMDSSSNYQSMLYTPNGPRVVNALMSGFEYDINDLKLSKGRTFRSAMDKIIEAERKISYITKDDHGNKEALIRERSELLGEVRSKLGVSPLMTNESRLAAGRFMTLGDTSIGFGITYREASKAMHKRSNILPISAHDIAHTAGIRFAAISGSAMTDLTIGVNQTMEHLGMSGLTEFVDAKGRHTQNRVWSLEGETSARLVFAERQIGSSQWHAPGGDSFGYSSNTLHKILKRSSRRLRGIAAKERGGSLIKFHGNVSDAALHPEIKAFFEAVHGKRKEYVSPVTNRKHLINYDGIGGAHLSNPITLGKTAHLTYDKSGNVVERLDSNGKAIKSGVFIGESITGSEINQSLRKTSSVRGVSSVLFSGGSILENDMIRANLGFNDNSDSALVMINGKKHLLKNQSNMPVGRNAAHIETAASNLGLTFKNGQIVVNETFINESYIRNLAAVSRKKGKLKELGSFLGLKYRDPVDFATSSGKGTTQIAGGLLYKDNIDQLTGADLLDKLKKLHSADEATLAEIGLDSNIGKHYLRMVKPTNDNNIVIPNEYLRRSVNNGMEKISLRTSVGFALSQSGVSNRARSGRLKIRLNTLHKHIEQLASGFTAIGNDKLASGLRIIGSDILHSPAYGDRSVGKTIGFMGGKLAGLRKPQFKDQLAELGVMASGGSKIGAVLKRMGAKRMHRMTVSDVLSDPAERPLANSVSALRGMMSGGGIDVSALPAGQKHRGGYVLDLGVSFPVILDSNGKHKMMSSIPILTSDFAGVGVEAGTDKLRLYGGVRDKNLALRGEQILARISEIHTNASRLGRTFEQQAASDTSFINMVGAYVSDVYGSAKGKGGLIHAATTFRPKGGLDRLTATYRKTKLEDFLEVHLSESDFMEHAKKSGLHSKEELKILREKLLNGEDVSTFGMMYRHPVHSQEQLLGVKIRASKQVNTGQLSVSDIVKKILGDFDGDTLQLLTGFGKNKDIQVNTLSDLYEFHKKSLLDPYKNSIDEADIHIPAWSNSGDYAGIIKPDEFLEEAGGDHAKAAILASNARRMRAGGGALYVAGPDSFAKRFNDILHASTGGEGIYRDFHEIMLEKLKDIDPDAAAELTNLSLSKNSSKISLMAGWTQDSIVNQALNKSSRTTSEFLPLMAELGNMSISSPDRVSLERRTRDSLILTLTEEMTEGVTHKAHGTRIFDVLGLTIDSNLDVNKKNVAGALSSIFEDTPLHSISRVMFNQGIAGEIPSMHQLTKFYDKKKGGQGMIGKIMSWLVGGDAGVLAERTEGSINIESQMLTGERNKAIQEAAAHADEIGDSSVLGRTSKALSEAWGNKGIRTAGLALGGAALGVALYDRLKDDETVPPPIMSNIGAPLPPSSTILMPDASQQTPMGTSYPAIGRVERPYSMRQAYNVSGSGSDSIDFGGIMTAGSPGFNIAPSRTSTIRDSRARSTDRNLPYQVRERLNSSF
jgi:hypothetical protein